MAERWAVTVTPGVREPASHEVNLQLAQRKVSRLSSELDEARGELQGAVLRAQEAGMTGGEIARILGVSRQHVSNIARRKS